MRYYVVNLDEESKSFTLLIVDGGSMGIISRGPESQAPAPNRLSGKAFFDENGDLDWKLNVYGSDTDLEFDQYVKKLRKYRKFEDHKSKIYKKWKKAQV